VITITTPKHTLTIPKRVAQWIAAGLFAVLALTTTAAGCNSITEPYNDAPISHKNDSPAAVYSMPDGFSNVATKCADHGHRIYVAYHGDGERAAIAVISDPACR